MDLDQAQPDAVGFIPPAPTQALVKLCQILWPIYVRACEFRLSVHLDASIKNIFVKLGQERLLICPNHSAHDDPVVAFALSALLDAQFYYLTAREIFMWHPSLRSLWLQHLGCYSVLRSSTDVEAFKKTRELLLEAGNQVVIFPEGEVSHQNRLVTALEPGTAGLALSVAHELAERGDNENLYVLPVGIAYRYPQDITPWLDQTLTRLAWAVNVNTTGTLADRAVAVFEAMLHVLETEYKVPPCDGASLGQGVAAFIDQTIDEIAAHLQMSVPSKLTRREKLHLLKKSFINKRYSRRDSEVSDVERLLYKQIKRAVNFAGLTNASFTNLDTREAVAELVRIEQCELMGKVTLRAPRTAVVSSSTPLNVRDYLPLYATNKQAAVTALNQDLRSAIADAVVYLAAAYPEHPLNDLEKEDNHG